MNRKSILAFSFVLVAGMFAGAELEHSPRATELATRAASPIALEACNATPEQLHTTEQDSFKLGICIVSTIFGGFTDPGAIAQKCDGALPAVIVDAIDDWTAKRPDAGAAAMSPEGQRLAEARLKAVTALAKAAPGR